jgi:acyl-coenzyme A thioesterase PaaI-like protein
VSLEDVHSDRLVRTEPTEQPGRPLSASFDGVPPGAFLRSLGLHLSADGDLTRGRAELSPHLWGRAQQQPRIGALVTMVDVIAGLLPSGTVSPTVNLNVQVLRPFPLTGNIDLTCRLLKAGRQLRTSEVLIEHADGLLVRGIATFLNNHHDRNAYNYVRPRPGEDIAKRFDDWLAARFLDRGTVEIDKLPHLSNWGTGTIQGGVQATLAELASESALRDHGAFVVEQMDISYLSAVRTGPLTAYATIVGERDPHAFVSVRLIDRGTQTEVTHATTVCRRWDSGS